MPCPQITLHRCFVADHFHDLTGFREARHGHNWQVEATVDLCDGMTETTLSEALDQWVSLVDYSLLNDQPQLQSRNPTAEVLAEWLYKHLEGQGFLAVETRICEKANYWAACRNIQ
jgi:6-pyruvoyl-tetrahydropterin synthase